MAGEPLDLPEHVAFSGHLRNAASILEDGCFLHVTGTRGLEKFALMEMLGISLVNSCGRHGGIQSPTAQAELNGLRLRGEIALEAAGRLYQASTRADVAGRTMQNMAANCILAAVVDRNLEATFAALVPALEYRDQHYSPVLNEFYAAYDGSRCSYGVTRA